MGRIYKIIIISSIMLLLLASSTLATTLNLEIVVSKERIKEGDEVTVSVVWKEKMQAADFSLLYDSEKLEYISSDIDEMFIKKDNNKISVFWFSDNNTDKTKIEFKFKAMQKGKVDLSTKIEGGFATGELVQPNNYEEGSATIKIGNNNLPIFVIILVLAIIFFIIINRKIQRRNKNGKIKKG